VIIVGLTVGVVSHRPGTSQTVTISTSITNVTVVSGRLVAGMLRRSHPRKAIPRPEGVPIDS
jgi:hypothetical protein